jgi:DNA-binding NtrC family response regulator
MSLYPANPILVIDDNAVSLRTLAVALRSHGIDHLVECQESREAMMLLSQGRYDLVLLDLTMPEVSGEQLLHLIGEQHPELPVIVVTGVEDVATAVRCLKQGALDYMVKPVESNRLVSGVRRAIEIKELRDQSRALNERVLSGRLQRPEIFAHILTTNKAMLAIFQYLESIAASRFPVLVTGETGVGKELMVQAIHASSRVPGPLVSINVAGLDNTIFSDTLFGHVKGAFTGATDRRQGLIEKATGGTLHLDEIGELSHESQVKLLRLLQEGEFLPIGADSIRMADIRVVASTNLDLAILQKTGQFRKDLYYRLTVHHIHIPPLRERRDDIPLLLNHYIDQAAQSLAKSPPVLAEDALMALSRYDYPGNVRELKTMVQDAVSRNQTDTLTLRHFNGWLEQQAPSALPTTSRTVAIDAWSSDFPTEQPPTLEQATRQLAAATLEWCHGNQSEAARILNISRQRLARILAKPPSC